MTERLPWTACGPGLEPPASSPRRRERSIRAASAPTSRPAVPEASHFPGTERPGACWSSGPVAGGTVWMSRPEPSPAGWVSAGTPAGTTCTWLVFPPCPSGSTASLRDPGMGAAAEPLTQATRPRAAASARWSQSGAGSRPDTGAGGRLPVGATGWAAPGTARHGRHRRTSTAGWVARPPRAGHRPAWSDATGHRPTATRTAPGRSGGYRRPPITTSGRRRTSCAGAPPRPPGVGGVQADHPRPHASPPQATCPRIWGWSGLASRFAGRHTGRGGAPDSQR